MPALDFHSSDEHEGRIGTDEGFNVLVTGFGPFSGSPDTNASWTIAKSLPSTLPPDSSHSSRIRIHTYHEPIPVAYNAVLERVPKFYSSEMRPHFVIHMGVARNQKYYTVEKIAHQEGYGEPDVEGEYPNHEKEPKFWSDYPSILETKGALEDVLVRWRQNLKEKRSEGALDPVPNVPKATAEQSSEGDANGEELRISTDAGRYLCEYLYYTSMAHSRHIGYDKGDGRTRTTTVFAHTPVDYSPEMISKGHEVIVALIRALVESRRHEERNRD